MALGHPGRDNPAFLLLPPARIRVSCSLVMPGVFAGLGPKLHPCTPPGDLGVSPPFPGHWRGPLDIAGALVGDYHIFGHFSVARGARAQPASTGFSSLPSLAAAAAVLSQVQPDWYQTVPAGWTVAHTFLQGLSSHAVLYGFFLAMVPAWDRATRAR